VAA
jgi:hypothetical protein